jgi:hypothetical protein
MTASTIGKAVTFTSKLIGTATNVKGSYKLNGVDIPNPFLRLSSAPTLERTNYYFGANGSPTVELSNFLEIGFNQLTPNTLTNNDSPWVITIIPYDVLGYTSPSPFNYGVTNLQIDIALYDEDYCVHKGSGSIVIPTNGASTTTTINF